MWENVNIEKECCHLRSGRHFVVSTQVPKKQKVKLCGLRWPKVPLVESDSDVEEQSVDHDYCKTRIDNGLLGFTEEEKIKSFRLLYSYLELGFDFFPDLKSFDKEEPKTKMSRDKTAHRSPMQGKRQCLSDVESGNMRRGNTNDLETDFDSDSDGYSTSASGCSMSSKVMRRKMKVIGELQSTYGNIEGITIGHIWQYRWDLAKSGVHCPPRTSIHYGKEGVYSLLLCGQNSAQDYGNKVVFNGEAARHKFGRVKRRYHPLSDVGSKLNHEMRRGNLALQWNLFNKCPVRLLRANTLKNKYAPREKNEAYRYEGLYRVTKAWRERQKDNSWEFRFLLVKNEENQLMESLSNQTDCDREVNNPHLDYTEYCNKKNIDIRFVPESSIPTHLMPACRNCPELPQMKLTSLNGRIAFVKMEPLRSFSFRVCYSKDNCSCESEGEIDDNEKRRKKCYTFRYKIPFGNCASSVFNVSIPQERERNEPPELRSSSFRDIDT